MTSSASKCAVGDDANRLSHAAITASTSCALNASLKRSTAAIVSVSFTIATLGRVAAVGVTAPVLIGLDVDDPCRRHTSAHAFLQGVDRTGQVAARLVAEIDLGRH